jgi:hypothetical protein
METKILDRKDNFLNKLPDLTVKIAIIGPNALPFRLAIRMEGGPFTTYFPPSRMRL